MANKTATESIDPATTKMLLEARRAGLETVWDRFNKQQPQCGFGQLGICCRNCNMGPCRIDPFGDGPDKGVCGATADIIVARNLLRMIAAGAAAHADHARDAVIVFKESAEGKARSYQIRDEAKFRELAAEYNISSWGEQGGAADLANALLSDFGRQEGSVTLTRRAPENAPEGLGESGDKSERHRQGDRGVHAPHPYWAWITTRFTSCYMG
jgi:6Fe-6S prismane cluster-containing protein